MSKYVKIDLHLHTNCSDGTDTPEELLAKVRAAGIELFAVTDHDTIKCTGIMPGLLGKDGPDYVNGSEFSCKEWVNGTEEKYHILGYGFDPENEEINAVIRKGRSLRMQKAEKRLEFLEKEYGFTFSREDLDAFFSMNSPAKPHLARMMVRYRYARDVDDAVENYIDNMKEEYHLIPQEAIRGILAAGGIPVLAHPPYGDGKGDFSGKVLEDRVVKLVGYGIEGLEGYYHKYSDSRRAEVLGLAEKYGLYVTAGSDYHGKTKTVPIGLTHLPDASAGPEGLRRFLKDVRKI